MRNGPDSRISTSASGPEQKSILIIRWKSIGDVVFTLPALRCLRSNFPGSHITYLTSPEFIPLIDSFSVANDILALDRQKLRRFHNGGLSELLALCRGILGRRYDIVVDFQGYGETALLSWLTRAPERWALVYRSTRSWAYTHAIPRDAHVHTVDAQLQLLSQCGLETSAPENFFELPPKNLEAANRLFQGFGLKTDLPTVFIQPFTSTPSKDWPWDKWLALARRLRELEIQPLFGGGPAERERLKPAASEGFPVSAGADLLTSCALAARCSLVIGGDTGLIHLANAAGCRVILMKHLHGKECPYGHPERVLMPKRAGARIAEIEVDTVLAEIRALVHSVV